MLTLMNGRVCNLRLPAEEAEGRAWDSETNCWQYGTYIAAWDFDILLEALFPEYKEKAVSLNNGGYIIRASDGTPRPVEFSSYCLRTPYTDARGTRIYIGDILHAQGLPGEAVGIVDTDYEGDDLIPRIHIRPCWATRHWPEWMSLEGSTFFHWGIIGDIRTSPELLDGWDTLIA